MPPDRKRPTTLTVTAVPADQWEAYQEEQFRQRRASAHRDGLRLHVLRIPLGGMPEILEDVGDPIDVDEGSNQEEL